MADQGTTQTPQQPAAEGGEGAPDQIGQLLEGFNSFRGEITGRLDALENDLFEPGDEGGQEPGGFPGAGDFPAIGAQPPMPGQPTFPGAQPPAFVPQQGQQPQPWEQPQGYPQPGQQPQAPAAMPQDAVQVLDQFIGQRLGAAMQQQQQALEQRMQQQFTAAQQQQELDQYADHLETRYPEFQDEAHTQRLLEATAAFAQQLGRPELAADPRLLERVLLAERAQAGQGAPGAQQSGEVHLETSTAAPGAPTGDVDPTAGIIAAAKGRRLL